MAAICIASQSDQHPEAADEPDVERRVPVQGRPGLAEVVVGRPGCPAGVVLGLGLGRGSLGLCRGLASLVLAEAGDHVAQRGELGGDRVAALGEPVDLGA